MFGRLWQIAPVLAVALWLGGCSMFAEAPSVMPFASLPPGSIKDTWQPSVVAAAVTVTQVAPAAGKAGRSGSLPRSISSCQSDSECVVILSALINDPKRTWLGQPQSAAEYANGTRFFAYRALKGRLSCRELRLASQDLQRAQRRLGARLAEVTAAHAAGAVSLAARVERELRAESLSRCTPPGQSQAGLSWARPSEIGAA
jgi:hypothetical protein